MPVDLVDVADVADVADLVDGSTCVCYSLPARRRAATMRKRARVSLGFFSRSFAKSQDAKARQVVGCSAMTWATRGVWSRTESSPKKSPGPRRAITALPRVTLACPEAMR